MAIKTEDRFSARTDNYKRIKTPRLRNALIDWAVFLTLRSAEALHFDQHISFLCARERPEHYADHSWRVFLVL